MVDCLREELNSGKDDCFVKVINYLEEKSRNYCRKLSDAFGSTEYFQKFQKCYENSDPSDGANLIGCPRMSSKKKCYHLCRRLNTFALPKFLALTELISCVHVLPFYVLF